jgi:peptidyl-tRNA hydrolase
MTNLVLGRFGIEELAILEQTLTRALEAIDVAQTRGLEVAMNQFN